MKKPFLFLLLLIFIMGASLAYLLYSSYSFHQHYLTIRPGDSESRVLKVMGKPDKIVTPGDEFSSGSLNAGWVKEFRYDATVLPEQWFIRFDSRGNVIGQSHNIM